MVAGHFLVFRIRQNASRCRQVHGLKGKNTSEFCKEDNNAASSVVLSAYDVLPACKYIFWENSYGFLEFDSRV